MGFQAGSISTTMSAWDAVVAPVRVCSRYISSTFERTCAIDASPVSGSSHDTACRKRSEASAHAVEMARTTSNSGSPAFDTLWYVSATSVRTSSRVAPSPAANRPISWAAAMIAPL